MKEKILKKSELSEKVAVIMGTRPGIIKMAPLVKEFNRREISNDIIHTGQHYSKNMDHNIFVDLNLEIPRYRVDSTKNYSTHAGQTAEMMKGIEVILFEIKPRIVLVCGDANTNLAAGMTARKLGIIVGHVEAGLRSHDWNMPEEHNRIILDHISELLFAPTINAYNNLILDNVRGQIFLTGNTIVDSTVQHLKIANDKSNILNKLKVNKRKYIFFTSHREENVDNYERLNNIIKGIKMAVDKIGITVIFPVHPRTKKRIKEFNIINEIKSSKLIIMTEPLSYLDTLVMIDNASLVATDSGGLQEESCILHTPCVTLRDNTERQETLKEGCNILSGTEPYKIFSAINNMIKINKDWDVPFGDGYASARIADEVEEAMNRGVQLCDISNKQRSISEI
ncbi:MAG: non-hydrolyzing UDP-N-acetylglucosamine 2-epimerase [Candidatus Kariarchaeaceae archaeon]|jgi:UDP-N-acetylglucosamine 2-epimerase (non-hydrolysing)